MTTDKIKEKFTWPIAISFMSTLVLIAGVLIKVLPNNELQAKHAADDSCEFRLDIVEGKVKKCESNLDYVMEKIENIDNQGKLILKYVIKLKRLI